MSFSDISSREAIFDAVREFDEIGRDAFLERYGFGRARKYSLYIDGQLYDSKAIVGVAHGYEYPDKGPLKSDEFVGGKHTVKPKLEELGFEVREQSNQWSFEELRDMCRKKGIPDSVIYQNSLGRYWRQAGFHAEKAQEVWKALFGSSFTLGDKRFNEAVFSYEAYVEACVRALHSMADILAQIINVVILRNRFPEHRVSAKKITEFMEKHGTAPQVTKRMREFIDSDVFRYIDAFCNTIKHRRLIKTHMRMEYGGDYRNETGIKFKQFHFKGVAYPETWGSDILKKYRNQIRDLVNNIGLALNRFVVEI